MTNITQTGLGKIRHIMAHVFRKRIYTDLDFRHTWIQVNDPEQKKHYFKSGVQKFLGVEELKKKKISELAQSRGLGRV